MPQYQLKAGWLADLRGDEDQRYVDAFDSLSRSDKAHFAAAVMAGTVPDSIDGLRQWQRRREAIANAQYGNMES